MSLRTSRQFTIGVICAIGLTAPAAAQVDRGRVFGTVRDESGAPVRGATVVAENDLGIPRTLTGTSNGKGRFFILGLRTGVWTFVIRAPGFVAGTFSMPVRDLTTGPPLQIKLRRLPPPPRTAFTDVDPKKVQAELDLAAAAADAGREAEAVERYQKLLQTLPLLTMIHARLGELYAKQEQYDKALGAYRRMLAAEPDHRGAREAISRIAYDLGVAAAAQGDGDAATRYLEEVITVDPDSARATEAKTALDRLRKSQMM